jgi:hypothetical protein
VKESGYGLCFGTIPDICEGIDENHEASLGIASSQAYNRTHDQPNKEAEGSTRMWHSVSSGDKVTRSINLFARLHLMPRLRPCGDLPPCLILDRRDNVNM